MYNTIMQIFWFFAGLQSCAYFFKIFFIYRNYPVSCAGPFMNWRSPNSLIVQTNSRFTLIIVGAEMRDWYISTLFVGAAILSVNRSRWIMSCTNWRTVITKIYWPWALLKGSDMFKWNNVTCVHVTDDCSRHSDVCLLKIKHFSVGFLFCVQRLSPV